MKVIDAPHLYASTLGLAPAPQLVTAAPGEIVPEAMPFPEGYQPTAAEEWARHDWASGLAEYTIAQAIPAHLRFARPEDADNASDRARIEKLVAASRAELALPYSLIGARQGEAGRVLGWLSLRRDDPTATLALLTSQFEEGVAGPGFVRRSTLALTGYASQVWGLKRVAAGVSLKNMHVAGELEQAGFEANDINWFPELAAAGQGSGMVQWWGKEL